MISQPNMPAIYAKAREAMERADYSTADSLLCEAELELDEARRDAEAAVAQAIEKTSIVRDLRSNLRRFLYATPADPK